MSKGQVLMVIMMRVANPLERSEEKGEVAKPSEEIELPANPLDVQPIISPKVQRLGLDSIEAERDRLDHAENVASTPSETRRVQVGIFTILILLTGLLCAGLWDWHKAVWHWAGNHRSSPPPTAVVKRH